IAGGYVGAGGIAATDPAAVGPDLHAGRAIVSTTHQIGLHDYLIPELRFMRSHYLHALLDAFLDRGVADVSAGTAGLSGTHVFTRRLMAMIGGGATVATPPPILESHAAVVSPEARAGVTYSSGRYAAVGGYTYGYTSLGPRIGFGQAHEARVEVRARP